MAKILVVLHCRLVTPFLNSARFSTTGHGMSVGQISSKIFLSMHRRDDRHRTTIGGFIAITTV